MPQGADHAPTTPVEQDAADHGAGWDIRFGPAPFEHGLPVEGIETSDTAPEVT